MNVVEEIWDTLDKIKSFSDRVRSGEFRGCSGKNLINTVVIGIGGSFLGPMFVYEAIRHHKSCFDAANGRKVRFLANVDPTDFYMATEGLDFEETLFVINSKTFTTAETMLNARTVKSMLLKRYKENHPEYTEENIIK